MSCGMYQRAFSGQGINAGTANLPEHCGQQYRPFISVSARASSANMTSQEAQTASDDGKAAPQPSQQAPSAPAFATAAPREPAGLLK